jgi:nitrite reductase/ring-hydroxylating ferredoxin subunit
MEKSKILICKTSCIKDPGSLGFEIEQKGEVIEGFIVRQDGVFYAYRNICPHTGSQLDYTEHQFLDSEAALIQCAVHEALFLIDTGECVGGPCLGECLDHLEIEVIDGEIYLQIDP